MISISLCSWVAALTTCPPQESSGEGTQAVNMPKSCKEAALALLVCMQKGECMKKGGTVKECLKSTDVDDCTMQRRAYFECKRSQLDMRTRIRGTRVY